MLSGHDQEGLPSNGRPFGECRLMIGLNMEVKASPDADRIIVHVGLHKTGSTFLQKRIFPYLEGDLVYFGGPVFRKGTRRV